MLSWNYIVTCLHLLSRKNFTLSMLLTAKQILFSRLKSPNYIICLQTNYANTLMHLVMEVVFMIFLSNIYFHEQLFVFRILQAQILWFQIIYFKQYLIFRCFQDIALLHCYSDTLRWLKIRPYKNEMKNEILNLIFGLKWSCCLRLRSPSKLISYLWWELT